MKIAVYSESARDEAGIRMLTGALLRNPPEFAAELNLRTRGWPSVRDVLPAVIKGLYFEDGDVEGLVVVVDSNSSTLHQVTHESNPASAGDCRVCLLRKVAEKALARVRPLAGRAPLKVAIGVAAPAIEAWYMVGHDPFASESGWEQLRRENRHQNRKIQLKRAVYGLGWRDQEHGPSVELAVQAAAQAAAPLRDLERLFPGGFGSLARSVREW
jgi:hypothetical protein